MNINEPEVMDMLLGDAPLGYGSEKEQDSSAEPLPPVEEMQRLGIRPLFGKERFTGPAYVNKKEKFEHRVIAYMKAACLSNVAIAQKTGFSPVTINYLVRQPFMELMILDEIKKHGDPALQLMSAESLAAAERLIAISKNAKNEETKRKANNDILDRKYGKPNQPMTYSKKSAVDMSDSELMEIVDKAEAISN